MNKSLGLIALLSASFVLAACTKTEKTNSAEHEASVAVVEEQISPEQQAAIDAIDQPILDEKNTDIPAEIANAPADTATPDVVEEAASEAVAQ